MTTYTLTTALRHALQAYLQTQCGGRCNQEHNACEAWDLDQMLNALTPNSGEAVAYGVFHKDGSAHIFQQQSTAQVFGETRELFTHPAPSAKPAELPGGECFKTGDICAKCGHGEFIAAPNAKLRAELDALQNAIHSCGPTCTKAGCVNRQLRDERDEYRKAADDQAAAHKVERDALSQKYDAREVEAHKLSEKLIAMTRERDALMLVYYEFQWTNPGDQKDQPESMFVWARVVPAWNQAEQDKVNELLSYKFEDKPCYRIRALYTAMAQGGEK